VSDLQIIAEATDYDGIIEAYRKRVADLGITNEMIDHLSGLQSGYVGKLLGPAQIRSIGRQSFGLLNQTLAVKMILVVDEEAAKQMQGRWEKRDKPANMPNRLSMKAAERFIPLIASEIGRRGGLLSAQARMAKLSPRQRKRIAKRAAMTRWKRRRREIVPAPPSAP